MKRLLLALAAAGFSIAGCNSGPPPNTATKDDVAALRKDHDQAIKSVTEDMDRKIRDANVALEKRLTEGFKDLPEMLATYQKMKNTLEDLTKLQEKLDKQYAAIDAKVTSANANLIAVLEAEEKLLGDRLAEIRRTLEQLKK